MRLRSVLTALVLFSFVVSCQQDRHVSKNTPRSVSGTTSSDGNGQRTSSGSESPSITSDPRSGGGQVSGNKSNRDVEQNRLQNTTPSSRSEEQTNQRTQRSEQSNIDLSKLESVRERNRRIEKKLEESKNEWPEKFDQQAHGKLEEHMQSQGWSDFELEKNQEEQSTEEQTSEMDRNE